MDKRELDPQERYQLRQILKTMETEGWTYLLAAWAQLRENKILGGLKRAKTEMPWRYQQGKLDGYDEAINLAEKLVQDVLNDDTDEKTPQQEAEEILKSVRGIE